MSTRASSYVAAFAAVVTGLVLTVLIAALHSPATPPSAYGRDTAQSPTRIESPPVKVPSESRTTSKRIAEDRGARTLDVDDNRITRTPNKMNVVEFRASMTGLLDREPRDPRWAPEHESRISAALVQYDHGDTTRVEQIACRSSVCVIRLQHSTSDAAEEFRSAVLNGRLLNTPAFLNQSNRCSLHSFVDHGTNSEELFLRCGGG